VQCVSFVVVELKFSFLDVAAEQRMRGSKGKSSGNLNSSSSVLVSL
jgi:hypothetical protein